ncbi:MAG: fibronectin type III domain-containing protein [Bacteroidales bacterium]|nr:fibronectin type III domain-containing protein [Bacteroidales bacterium]
MRTKTHHNKHHHMRFAVLTFALISVGSLALLWGCNDDEDEHFYDPYTQGGSGGGSGSGTGGGGGTTPDYSTPSAPTGLNCSNVGTSSAPRVQIRWNSSTNATGYYVYRSSSSSSGYQRLTSTSNTFAYDESPMTGTNYYRVSAYNSNGEGSQSSYTSVNIASSVQKPSAPTGLQIQNYGNNNLPDLRLSWNASTGATSYDIYHSTSSSSGYSKVNTVTTTSAGVPMPANGNNYYKVKAVNSAGESGFSSYVSYNYTVAYSPCNPTVTASISGSTCRLSWTFPSSSGCGRPTSVRVRAKVSDGNWTDVATLSGTATSYSFTCSNYFTSQGYLYVGIIGENAQGSGSTSKIYNRSTGTWY